jgi:hypothetical protein
VILTAAHCIPKEVEFTYNGVDYTTPVELNSYYLTEGSMYKVYLGLKKLSEILSSNSIQVDVSKVISVSG